MPLRQNIRLGDVLLQHQCITEEQLQSALQDQKQSGRRLGRVLIDAGVVSEEQIADAIASQLQLPVVDLTHYDLKPSIIKRLSEHVARRLRVVVLNTTPNGGLLVGMQDPTDIAAHDELAAILGDIDVAVVAESPLTEALDSIYLHTEEIVSLAENISHDMKGHAVDLSSANISSDAQDVPIARLFQNIIEDAVHIRASDIHIEPQEHALHVRFRIDGLLHLQMRADTNIAAPLIQRLKLLSGLDISEKRLPQDGRFQVRVGKQVVDIRLSTMPTQCGESAVMRLLNQSSALLHLDELGMPEDMLKRLRILIRRQSGMILVTGPTGSGKTTTLYAALTEVNTPEQKIITVEDPVEYRLPGIMQVQVSDKIDLSFSRVLRTALRQDPDMILVGEMRDAETTQIGLRAAMTGHLVFSTVHTRDTASTLFRLLDMGVPKYLVASSVQVIVAQRLLRRVCASCSETYQPNIAEQEWLRAVGVEESQWGGLRTGHGCSHCNTSGYHGRTGVYEMLEMGQALGYSATQDDVSSFMRMANESLKGHTLLDAALEKMLQGITTVSEVIRISNQVED